MFVHEYGHYIQHLYWGGTYMSAIGLVSLISSSQRNGKHLNRWVEADASRKGARYFDRKYGKNSSLYHEMSKYLPSKVLNTMFYDKKAFEKGAITDYLNPRTGVVNYRAYPTDADAYHFWDFLEPTSSMFLLPLYILGIDTLP
jgi:hypothetical protein